MVELCKTKTQSSWILLQGPINRYPNRLSTSPRLKRKIQTINSDKWALNPFHRLYAKAKQCPSKASEKMHTRVHIMFKKV